MDFRVIEADGRPCPRSKAHHPVLEGVVGCLDYLLPIQEDPQTAADEFGTQFLPLAGLNLCLGLLNRTRLTINILLKTDLVIRCAGECQVVVLVVLGLQGEPAGWRLLIGAGLEVSRQDGIGVGGVGEREPRRTGCAGLLERVWLRRRVRLGLDAPGAGYGLRTLWRTTGAISIEGPVHNGGWASAGIDLRRDRLEVGLGLAAAGQEEDHSHNERTQVSAGHLHRLPFSESIRPEAAGCSRPVYAGTLCAGG